MTNRERLEASIFGPRAVRGRFVLTFVIVWVAAVIAAALILTMQIGSPVTWVFAFFFWPSCIGDGCQNAGLTLGVMGWLTFLTWVTARLALWVWWKYA